MSTQSPIDQQQSGGSQYGSGQSENGKSGGIMNLGFLKGLTEKKNTRGMEIVRLSHTTTNAR